jgi:hypothetical protein
MTGAILALGAAQKTDLFTKKNLKTGSVLNKIIKAIYDAGKDCLDAAILLTPDSLKLALENSSTELADEIPPGTEISIDFFYIKNGNDFAEEKVETIISSMIPPNCPIKATSMTVDRETLLGMLTENENEAGLAAYSMLNDGLVLFGYENFYRLVLEAFARKLSN